MYGDDLKCNATNCAHNENHECMAGQILVVGSEANSTEDTYCGTFVDKEESGFTNVENNGYTSPQNIKCEAYKCKYNENLNCTADYVKINEDDASCETFIEK